MPKIEKRIADGYLFGDFQYSTDSESEDFLRRGVFSCYQPVNANTAVLEKQKELSDEDWLRLLYIAHADKSEAFLGIRNVICPRRDGRTGPILTR